MCPVRLSAIRDGLTQNAPQLSTVFFATLAPRLLPAGRIPEKPPQKTFNDPVWGNITLPPNAVALLETPLMQRLRYVRQLGVAHLLYPGAHHSRLEHCMGCAHAAGLMFDALSRLTKPQPDNPQDLRDLLVCAALVHDCGHAAFSHASEGVLEDFFHEEWEALRRYLGTVFPPVELPGYARNEETANTLTSRSAELATLLFLLSPSFEGCAQKLLWGHFRWEEAVTFMVALIIGRPPLELIHASSAAQHTYISRIVSGDLDADKLDYVSRDAYYAGLTVSVDTARLLGQLRPVSVAEDTPGAMEAGLVFPADGPSVYHLFGIAPAGVSTLEMFVMTRSYLFDRIYSHHKVNAAEMALESILAIWADARRKVNPDDAGWLALLYGPCGDDGLLAVISTFPDCNLEGVAALPEAERADLHETWGYLSRKAGDFLERRLPYRALALASRCLETKGDASSIWSEIVDTLGEYEFVTAFEEKISAELHRLLGETVPEIFICAPKQNPVKEDPDIWIATQNGQRLVSATHYFNPEQLANAYRETKLTQWIFCDSPETVPVSAAASRVFFEEFQVLPNHDAFEKCKLSRKKIVEYLNTVRDASASEFAAILSNPADYKKLNIRPNFWRGVFEFMDGSGEEALHVTLATQVMKTGLTNDYHNDLAKGRSLLKLLAQHAHSNWGNLPVKDEADLQNKLKTYLNEHAAGEFFVEEHSAMAGGFTDLLVTYTRTSLRFVIELKNSKDSASQTFRNHAGQPAAYASDSRLSPVSFLYTTFRDATGAARLCDSIEVRSSSSSQSAHAIFCVGLMAPAGVPSSHGKDNVAPAPDGEEGRPQPPAPR